MVLWWLHLSGTTKFYSASTDSTVFHCTNPRKAPRGAPSSLHRRCRSMQIYAVWSCLGLTPQRCSKIRPRAPVRLRVAMAKDWVKFSAPAKTHSRQLKRALLIFQALLLEFKFEERSLNESSLCSSGPYDLSMLGHLLTHLNSSSGTFPCSSSICDVWSFSSFIWTAKKFVCCLYFSMSLT